MSMFFLAGLSKTWSKNPKTGFLASRPNFRLVTSGEKRGNKLVVFLNSVIYYFINFVHFVVAEKRLEVKYFVVITHSFPEFHL